jgi:hypothetical protein
MGLVKEDSHHVVADFWFDWDEDEHSLRFVPMDVSKSWLINLMATNWYFLDEHCGHGIVQSEKEYQACDNARHKMKMVLNSRGYCYGKTTQSYAEMKWERCTRESLR